MTLACGSPPPASTIGVRELPPPPPQESEGVVVGYAEDGVVRLRQPTEAERVREVAFELFSAIFTNDEWRLRAALAEGATFESIRGGSSVKSTVVDALLFEFGPNTRRLTGIVARRLDPAARRALEGGESWNHAVVFEPNRPDKVTMTVECNALLGPGGPVYANQLVLTFVRAAGEWKLTRFAVTMP